MRLTAGEIRAIKVATARAFGADAIVRLFGSRVDDSRKGGDIDLHVEVAGIIDEWAARSRFEDNLFSQIEEQRVDLIVRNRADPMRGIDLIAHRDGIAL